MVRGILSPQWLASISAHLPAACPNPNTSQASDGTCLWLGQPVHMGPLVYLLFLPCPAGNPWYNSGAGARASREAGQGEAGTSGNGEAAQEGPRSSKRERQQKVEGPRVAVLLLRGFRDNTRADRTVCELPVNDDGFISIPANRFFVTAMQVSDQALCESDRRASFSYNGR